MKSDAPGLRLGPIWLMPGVTLLHFGTFMYASLVTMGVLVFINVGQAYVLSENLGLPISQFGQISGVLVVVTEVTFLLFAGVYGVLSDRIGRRAVYAFGLFAMGLAYVFYPLARSVEDLAMYRIIYGMGTAAATGMITTISNDYPQEISRGKMIALSGMLLGIGAAFSTLFFGRLPQMFIDQGVDTLTAGRYTHWIVAAISGFSVVILALGLRPGTPVKRKARPPFRKLMTSGLREAKNPRILLAYLSAFVGRSDLVIIGTFSVAWGTVAGQELGLSIAESVQRGAFLSVISLASGLVWSPVMGIIMDRMNRVAAIGFSAALGTVALLSTWLVDDPFDNVYLPVFVLLGIGQISCLYASQALIGQEAPLKERGAVIGAFQFCGALGILFFTGLGGLLFDMWIPAGPFIFVGGASALVFLFAVIVYRKAPGRMTF